MRRVSKYSQQGITLVSFLLMIPVLFGFMFLSLEGGRYLRLKAAIADNAEVVGLAVSARQLFDEEKNNKFATRYMQALLPDYDIESVTVDFEDLRNATKIDDGYLEFHVKIVTKHNSWFFHNSSLIPGFDREMTIINNATIRKYLMPSSGLLDVVFVPDFSNTHDCSWDRPDCQKDETWKEKIEHIKEAIGRASQSIEALPVQNVYKNAVALVPFNYFTADKPGFSPGNVCFARQQMNSNTVERTIDKLFEEKKCFEYPAYEDIGLFHTIPFTDSADKLIDEMRPMTGGWNSSSFEGIIRAGQVALTGENPNRIILVISTAKDSVRAFYPAPGEPAIDKPRQFHKKLNDESYCDQILDKLNSQRSHNNQPVKAKLYAVGFGHNVNGHERLRNCVGKDNLLEKRVDSADGLYDLIMETVNQYIESQSDFYEEIGHIHRS